MAKNTRDYVLKFIAPATLMSKIKAEDKVTVEDAPSYWSWASFFTVVATYGEMASLEMINELIEIARLSKCPS